MSLISHNLQVIRGNIATIAQASKKDVSKIQLMAVSKTQSVDAIIDAIKAGQLIFGENYEQEGVKKILTIKNLYPDLKLEWHFIGPIQSNKTRHIAENFDWVHSVDRERIARRLSEQRPELMQPLNICIQVNIDNEETKNGINPNEVETLAKFIKSLPHLRLRGLMAIPFPDTDSEKRRESFVKMRQLFDNLCENGFDLDTLSMGMSDDMEIAIEEGATMLRIGTAIFGQRKR